jgi:hypothetical protein
VLRVQKHAFILGTPVLMKANKDIPHSSNRIARTGSPHNLSRQPAQQCMYDSKFRNAETWSLAFDDQEV